MKRIGAWLFGSSPETKKLRKALLGLRVVAHGQLTEGIQSGTLEEVLKAIEASGWSPRTVNCEQAGSGGGIEIESEHTLRLLARLDNVDDAGAWQDFFDIYWRLIHGVAIAAGLSEEDGALGGAEANEGGVVVIELDAAQRSWSDWTTRVQALVGVQLDENAGPMPLDPKLVVQAWARLRSGSSGLAGW